MTNNENDAPDTHHNIERNLQSAVEKIQEDLIGNAYPLSIAGLTLALILSVLGYTGLLNVGVPYAVPFLLAAGFTLRLFYLKIEKEPHSRLLDEHLALLAAIGFNERSAAKLLQIQLKGQGYITLGQLKKAQALYRANNVRKYNLRLANEKGAKMFLAGAE